MSRVKWTPKAEQDLDEIREHIARYFNVDLAIEVVDDLIDTVEWMLSDNPLSGTLLESNPFFSKIVYKGNAIFYCENPEDKDLYIVYVQPRKSNYKSRRLNDLM